MKQLWSGIKSIITLKPRSQQLISQIRVDNIDYDDPKDIANQFNKFFINAADDVRKTVSRKPHIIELTKKLIKTSGIFYELRYSIPRNLSIMLYNALIYPLLLYGITSCGLTFTSNFDSLLAIQNNFLKIINFSTQYDSPHPLYSTSKILKVNDLHKLQLASFVYASYMQQNPQEFHS